MLPLRNAIVELLKKEKVVTDDELIQKLQPKYPDITTKKLFNELLDLEILGLVRVYEIGKGRKRIELMSGSSEVIGEFDF